MIQVRLRTRFRNDATGCLLDPARTRRGTSVTLGRADGRFVARSYGEAGRVGAPEPPGAPASSPPGGGRGAPRSDASRAPASSPAGRLWKEPLHRARPDS